MTRQKNVLANTLITLAVIATTIFTSTAEGEEAPSLAPFVDQYSSIESVYMKASAVVYIGTPEGTREGNVSFEYWEADNRYRINSRADKELGLAEDTDVAFDGEQFQIWLLESDILSMGKEDSRNPTAAMMNPLFLPVDFLRTADSGDLLLRLSDVVERAGQVENAEPIPAAASASTAGQLAFVAKDDSGSYQVSVARHAEMWVPETISQRKSDSGILGKIELKDYRSVDGIVLPQSLSASALDDQGQPVMRAEVLVTDLEVNQPIPDSVFALAGTEKTKRRNSDTQNSSNPP
ncbi:MAG: hypothetical protein AAF481_14115 [Acidobacteriota bacterium]